MSKKIAFAKRWGCRMLAALGAAFLLCFAVFYGCVWFLPYPEDAKRPPPASTWIEDRNGQLVAAFVSASDDWQLPLAKDQISPHLLKAIVAVEDRRFYEHHGVDWYSVAGAAVENLESLGIRRGASTLTMQVQRLRDPRPRSFLSKFEQAVRACQIERAASKDEILVEYLNRAPFGGNLTGAGAASWRYFGKRCADLSLGQAALLAGLPQSPNRYRPDRTPELSAQRRKHVLQTMLDLRQITLEEFHNANVEPIDAQWRPLPQVRSDGSEPTLTTLASLRPGQCIRTTLDPRVQQLAFDAAASHFKKLRASGVDSLAAVILDTPTGNCLAVVSLSDTAIDTDLSRRTRSTGSVLKPFLYAAAFEAGVARPDTILLDSPQAWAGYEPANFDRSYRGPLTAAEALAQSRNIPAMQILAKTGVGYSLATMDSFGIVTPNRGGRTYGLSLAIGGAESSPWEIADAYATLARGGVRIPASLVAVDTPAPCRVLSEAASWDVLRALSDPARTEAAGATDALRLGTAWKTGTSNGFRDAWCAAVTPKRTVVIWLGNASGGGSNVLIGTESAAPLALELIAKGETFVLPAPWRDANPRMASDAHTPQRQRENSVLAIVSPRPNAEVFLQPDSPAENQQIALRSTGGAGEKRSWFLDGEALMTSTGEALFWRPAPGSHELRVIDSRGNAASVRVHVR